MGSPARKTAGADAARQYTLSPFQQRAYAYSSSFDLVLDGGKGGGKTALISYIVVGDIESYADRCRVLVIRKTYKGIADIEDRLRSLFQRLYPGVRSNAARRTRLKAPVPIAFGERGSLASQGRRRASRPRKDDVRQADTQTDGVASSASRAT